MELGLLHACLQLLGSFCLMCLPIPRHRWILRQAVSGNDVCAAAAVLQVTC